MYGYKATLNQLPLSLMPTQSNPDFIKVADSNGVSVDIRFSSIVEWINEGVFCVNSDGKILYANDQFCRNLGYTKIELIGQNILDHFFNEDFVRLSRQKLEMRKKGLSDVYEIKMRKKNGDGIWIRVNGKPVFNSDGKFVCSVGIHIDITKQKELEEELVFAKEDLESRVITRTRQLSEANAKLNQQMKERKMAEVSLIHSEKRFRDIYINSPDAIYVESHEGIILDLNEATCKLHNTTADNLLGKSIYEVSPLTVHEEIRKRQPKIISGEITKFESECITAEGQVLPIEISVAPITFKDKPALLMHVRDISDRKKHQHLLQKLNEELEEKVKARTQEIEEAKAELEKQKAFLSQIIDASPGLVFVKDMDGKYLLINQTMADYYNIGKSDMLGKRDGDFQFSESDLEMFKRQDQDVIDSNSEIAFPEQSFINTKTGEKTWLSVVKKVIPSIDNRGKNILGVATDVTQIKKVKEDILVSEQLYREIARNLPKAAMFIFDKDLRYILAEGPLVGTISKSKEEIEGKTIYEVIRASEIDRVAEIYTSILKGEVKEFEQMFFERTMRVHHIPIRNAEAEIVYGMVMIFDISDLKQTQQELIKRNDDLVRSNEELERFAYVASHDLQGPLRTIASYLQLLELRNRNNLDKESVEFIEFSVSGAKRLQTLIQDLLTYSKISSTPKPFVAVNLKDVSEVISKNLESTIKAANAQLMVEDLPTVSGDPSQLLQIMQNLVDNALKFVKDKQPVIKISSSANADEWQISIQDNGIGIKEEFKERIFRIFQRLHTDAEYSGTGVGLAICKKIVHLHGGRIWFDSVPGEGTTFHFTISKKKKIQNPESNKE